MEIDKTLARSDIDEFDKMVQTGYQGKSRFRTAVTVSAGEADDFRSLSTPPVYLSGIEFPSWSRVPPFEKKEAADGCAKEVVCLENELVLGTLASASIPSSVGVADIDVTQETLVAVARALIAQDADPIRNEVCIACPYQWRTTLHLDKRIEWADGTAKFRMGETEFEWKFEFLPIHATNGSFDPAQGIGYAFTKESIGLAYNREPTGDIDWDLRSLSWELSGAIGAAAAVRLSKGIVKILGPKA